MSHCVTRVPIEAKNFLSQKIFNFFSKQVFFIFQDNEISFSEKKIFPNFESESRYRNEIPKAETTLYL